MSDAESMAFEAREERAESEMERRVLRHNRRERSYNPERGEPPRLKCIDCGGFVDECECDPSHCPTCGFVTDDCECGDAT